MTPEHEAEARALLAQIAKTYEWARIPCPCITDCLACRRFAHHDHCENCKGNGWIPLADLEVAAWRAWVWLAKRWCKLEAFSGRDSDWSVWRLSSFNYGLVGGFEADPIIAVFKAVLALLKEEQAYERQS